LEHFFFASFFFFASGDGAEEERRAQSVASAEPTARTDAKTARIAFAFFRFFASFFFFASGDGADPRHLRLTRDARSRSLRLRRLRASAKPKKQLMQTQRKRR
jgi:hypothetical protein